jgi:hypothetical protein
VKNTFSQFGCLFRVTWGAIFDWERFKRGLFKEHLQITQAIAKSRRWLACLLVPWVVLGLATKVYTGPGEAWVRFQAGGVFYVGFWTILVLVVWPGVSSATVAGAVVFVTCCVEVLQLWHPPFLEWVRSSWSGQLLLGNSFSWWDFPPYFVGGLIGYIVARTVKIKGDS